MLRLAFDFIITWRETRTRPNAYEFDILFIRYPFWCLIKRICSKLSINTNLKFHSLFLSSIWEKRLFMVSQHELMRVNQLAYTQYITSRLVFLSLSVFPRK